MPDHPNLAALAAGLAKGEVTAAGLARDFLDRVDASPAAFLSVDGERLAREADASDRRRREGRELSRLDGVLFAVKDNIDVAGYRTTNGSKTRAAAEAATVDAGIVASLRAAGLVVAGKTNMSEFAFSGLGLNPHFDTPGRHRHDPPRVPGGSSSGSAVAIADGLVPLALGTDTAGSLRVPPAFTGTVGYRATRGRYSMQGVLPLASSFDTLGAITRGVADVIAFDALTTARPDVTAALGRETEILVDLPFLRSCGVTADVEHVVDAALETLGRRGGRLIFRQVEQLWRVREVIERRGWPGGFEAHRQFSHLLAGGDRRLVDPRVTARLELGGRMDPVVVKDVMAWRAAAIRDFEREVANAVVLLPTVKHVPPLLLPLEADGDLFARTNLETLRLTMIGSFLDAPAVALPVGSTDEGLPVSISLLGSSGGDERVLSAAAYVEALLDGRDPGRPHPGTGL